LDSAFFSGEAPLVSAGEVFIVTDAGKAMVMPGASVRL
jgi:hypothetical protein